MLQSSCLVRLQVCTIVVGSCGEFMLQDDHTWSNVTLMRLGMSASASSSCLLPVKGPAEVHQLLH